MRVEQLLGTLSLHNPINGVEPTAQPTTSTLVDTSLGRLGSFQSCMVLEGDHSAVLLASIVLEADTSAEAHCGPTGFAHRDRGVARGNRHCVKLSHGQHSVFWD